MCRLLHANAKAKWQKKLETAAATAGVYVHPNLQCMRLRLEIGQN